MTALDTTETHVPDRTEDVRATLDRCAEEIDRPFVGRWPNPIYAQARGLVPCCDGEHCECWGAS